MQQYAVEFFRRKAGGKVGVEQYLVAIGGCSFDGIRATIFGEQRERAKKWRSLAQLKNACGDGDLKIERGFRHLNYAPMLRGIF